MFGLSTLKLVGIGLAILTVVSVVFAGYRFVSNQIDDRVNAAIATTQSADAARINAATAAATAAEAKADAAAAAATVQRLDDLNAAQQQNAKSAASTLGSLNHDLAHATPAVAADDANRDFAYIDCVLDHDSGAAGSCDRSPVAAASAPNAGSPGAGRSPLP